MKVKEILNLKVEELKEILTESDFEKLIKLNIEIWELLDGLQESARLSGQEDDEEHMSISEYLEYLIDMKYYESNIECLKK